MRSPARALAAALAPVAAVAMLALLGGAAGAAGSRRVISAMRQCNIGGLEATRSPVQLTFWEAMPDQNGVTLSALTDAFNASQRHVRVTLVDQGSYQSIWTKVQAGLSTGNLPDITQIVDYDQQGAIDSGAFIPVQTCIEAARYSTSDFLPRVTGYWTVKGVMVGMPFNVSAPIVIYNKQSFAKAGLNPNAPPATMTAYLSDAAALKRAGIGTGFMVDPSFVEHWLATQHQLFVNHANGRAARATHAAFNTAAGVRTFATLSDLVRREGAVTNADSGPDEFDNLLGIGSGKYGMTVDYSSDLGTIYAELHSYPNVTPGVGPFPLMTTSAGGGVTAGGAALYITKKEPPIIRAAAWEYLAYLDSATSQATWAAGTGYIPIRRSAAASAAVQHLWTTEPGYKVAYDELTQGSSNAATAGPVIGPFSQVQQDMVDALTTMFDQGTSPARATANAASTVTQTMTEYNHRL